MYLVTRIISTKAQDVSFLIDGSNSYAAWLNGKKVIEKRGKFSNVKIGDRFVNVSLKKGENLLFVKINRNTNVFSWDLVFNISSNKEAKRIFCVNYTGDFVMNPVVTDSFEVYAGPFLSGKVEVMDLEDKIIHSASFENQNTNFKPFVISDLSELKEGFYKTRLTVGEESVEEIIYKGDFDKFAKKANEQVDKIKGGDSSIEDLKANMYLVNRRNFEIDEDDTPYGIRYINRNKVFWGYALYCMLQDSIPPTRIMTYPDDASNSQTFIFHKDDRLRKNIPLVIFVPHNLKDTMFLNEWYVTNLDQLVQEISLADQYGCAIAWTYAHGKYYTPEKMDTEISSVINRLSSEYDIDHRAIFLLGSCGGGYRALIQLARTPERYACCALRAPVTLTGGIGERPIELIPSMGNTPIIIEHGAFNDHSSVEHSRIFVTKAKEYGLPVTYIETSWGNDYANNDFNRFAFEFFRKFANNE